MTSSYMGYIHYILIVQAESLNSMRKTLREAQEQPVMGHASQHREQGQCDCAVDIRR